MRDLQSRQNRSIINIDPEYKARQALKVYSKKQQMNEDLGNVTDAETKKIKANEDIPRTKSIV